MQKRRAAKKEISVFHLEALFLKDMLEHSAVLEFPGVSTQHPVVVGVA